MTINKALRVAFNVAREIDKENKRAIREIEQREKELIIQKKKFLKEEQKIFMQQQREEKMRKKKQEKSDLEKEMNIFKKRQEQRYRMRLEFINKQR